MTAKTDSIEINFDGLPFLSARLPAVRFSHLADEAENYKSRIIEDHQVIWNAVTNICLAIW